MGARVAVAPAPGSTRCGCALPNRHHFLVDLAPFGLDNPNEVFHAADRPYGLIEGTVLARATPADDGRVVMPMDLVQPLTWPEALAARAEQPDAAADRRRHRRHGGASTSTGAARRACST